MMQRRFKIRRETLRIQGSGLDEEYFIARVFSLLYLSSEMKTSNYRIIHPSCLLELLWHWTA